MSWNYRVMRVEHPVPEEHTEATGEATNTMYEVVEVYYDDDDKPTAYCTAGLDSAETPEELRSALIFALNAVDRATNPDDKPAAILTPADFGVVEEQTTT